MTCFYVANWSVSLDLYVLGPGTVPGPDLAGGGATDQDAHGPVSRL